MGAAAWQRGIASGAVRLAGAAPAQLGAACEHAADGPRDRAGEDEHRAQPPAGERDMGAAHGEAAGAGAYNAQRGQAEEGAGVMINPKTSYVPVSFTEN